MKPWLVLLLALALPAGAATPPAAQPKAPTGQDLAEAAGASLIGKYAPPLRLTTIDGQKIDLAKLYGKKPVYLKFWATWCVPCRLQMPHFETVERSMGRDIEVVAVNAGFNETKEVVDRYRQEMGLTMPIAIDDGRAADAFHLRVTPQHIVIGRDGRILYVGHLADARLDQALARAVAEPAAQSPGPTAQKSAGHTPVPALQALGGGALALHQGAKPTVVFFFSPWCESYFKTSRPAMSKACGDAREGVAALSHTSRARWVGVASGLWATQKDLADYQHEHGLDLPLALDETGAVFRAYKVADVPSFVVLDPAGHVIARARTAELASQALASGKL
jgi:thiol-disulfide isomerase/thioredoxin